MRMVRLWPVLLVASVSFPQSAPDQAKAPEPASTPLTAETIMARVATNQDRSEALRKQYVYKQHVHIVSHKPKGRLLREETTDYDVIPVPDGTEKKLKLLTGRYLNKGKYERFEGEHPPGGDSLDGGLISGLRDDLINDKTKDGLGKGLFPLTSAERTKYDFALLGTELQAGRSTYHIGFRPKDKDEMTWAGEAYIDATEFEPVRVFTRLSRRMPFVVRTMLGTDVPGIGFNVVYQRQPDGVWFPATFGTEFRIRALFFINRDVTMSLENSDFEHTHVESRMKVIGPAD